MTPPTSANPANTGQVSGQPARGTTDWGQNLREAVTTIVSLAIVVLTIWMLYEVYLTARSPQPNLDAYQRQKDILLLALGLLGTVTGYYLGRVPAERQADASRDAANTARHSEERVKNQVRIGLDEIQQKNNAKSGASGGAAADPVNATIDRLRASL